MKTAFLIFLLMMSPAFADNQNVYDFFRQLPNSDSAIVDDQTTTLIKRHMANLLHPVDITTMKKAVVKDGDFASATGTGGTDDVANPLAP